MELDKLCTTKLHEEGSELCVKDPLGNDTDFYITLAGIDSKRFKAAMVKMRKAILANPEADLDVLKAEAIAECILSWRGLTDNDKEVEFTLLRGENLFLSAPYIYEQANDFIGERINFMKD